MRRKTFIHGIMLFAMVSFFMSGLAAAMATGDATTPEYNEAVETQELNFQAALTVDGTVETSWTEYTPANFNYYKVIRSQENNNPVYPDDGYIYVGGEGDLTYTDTEVPAGKSYYRVCSIAKPARYCSPVVTIENGEDSSTQETENSTQETSVTSQDLSTLTLTGSVDSENEKFLLAWTVDDGSKIQNGFKVVYSKTNQEPVYPGDNYHYLEDSAVRSDVIEDAVPGYTYHVRVCQYNGAGTCLAYSNAVALKLEGTPTLEETEFDETKSFDDTEEHWGRDYAEDLKSNCGVYGYKDDAGEYLYEFKPDAPITRAELVRMAMSCLGAIDYDADYVEFSDVHEGDWFKTDINAASAIGWVDGYDDGTFRPNNNINRAEALKIILRSYYSEDKITDEGENFPDVSSSDWFEKYVSFAVKKAYIQGYMDGTFAPGKDITRAEAAKIISLMRGF